MLDDCMNIGVAVLNSVTLRPAAHCSERTSVICSEVVSFACTAKRGSIKVDFLPTCCLWSFLVVESVDYVYLLVAVTLSQSC